MYSFGKITLTTSSCHSVFRSPSSNSSGSSDSFLTVFKQVVLLEELLKELLEELLKELFGTTFGM